MQVVALSPSRFSHNDVNNCTVPHFFPVLEHPFEVSIDLVVHLGH